MVGGTDSGIGSWGPFMALLLISCVTLSKLLNYLCFLGYKMKRTLPHRVVR